MCQYFLRMKATPQRNNSELGILAKLTIVAGTGIQTQLAGFRCYGDYRFVGVV
jgi:hypothetical protein